MSSNESSTEKSARKRKLYEPEFNATVRTYGSGAKKGSNVSLGAEPPLPPKRPRISGPDYNNEASGSSKRKTEPYEKSTSGSGSGSGSDSESDSGYTNSDSEIDPKGKKKAKKDKKHKSKSKKRESKSKEHGSMSEKRGSAFKKHEESESESSNDEVAPSLKDLSPETQVAIAMLIEKDRKKKRKGKSKKGSSTGPSIDTKASEPKVKSEVKREGGGSTQVLSETEANLIIVNHLRSVMFQLTSWENMYDIQTPLEGLDDKGKPKYWEVAPNGDNILRPRIEDSFDSNWKIWGPDFVRQWHDRILMGMNSGYLSQVSDDIIKHKLKKVTWKSMKDAWKKNRDGPQARNKKNVKSMERNRTTMKVQWRSEARKGTPLENPEYDFLFMQEYTSPSASDAEDNSRLVVNDPIHRSDLVRDIQDRLAQKFKSGTKRTSTTRKDKVIYVKVNTPLPELLNNVRIHRWAIDDQYFKSHKAEIDKKLAYIDLEAVQPPDLTEFLKRYGKLDREYLQSHPCPNKAQSETAPAVPSSSGDANNMEPVPGTVGSDLEIDPLLQSPRQNPTNVSTPPSAPPTPNVAPACAQQVPELLPYASTKTVSVLAAQYAAESAQLAFSSTAAGKDAEQLPSNPGDSTTSVPVPTPRNKGRKSAAKSAPEANSNKEKPLTRTEQKKQATSMARNIEGNSADAALEALLASDGASGRKMPIRLRVKKSKGF